MCSWVIPLLRALSLAPADYPDSRSQTSSACSAIIGFQYTIHFQTASMAGINVLPSPNFSILSTQRTSRTLSRLSNLGFYISRITTTPNRQPPRTSWLKCMSLPRRVVVENLWLNYLPTPGTVAIKTLHARSSNYLQCLRNYLPYLRTTTIKNLHARLFNYP
jgi:hypothetical protein